MKGDMNSLKDGQASKDEENEKKNGCIQKYEENKKEYGRWTIEGMIKNGEEWLYKMVN